jgi:hypothetical protein
LFTGKAQAFFKARNIKNISSLEKREQRRQGTKRPLINPSCVYIRVQSQTLFGVLAPLGAALIQFGVDENMPAAGAAPPGLVLEEFHRGSAVRAGYFKNVAGPPEGGVLSRTHGDSHKNAPGAVGISPHSRRALMHREADWPKPEDKVRN